MLIEQLHSFCTMMIVGL